eukprot:gene38967-21077_t
MSGKKGLPVEGCSVKVLDGFNCINKGCHDEKFKKGQVGVVAKVDGGDVLLQMQGRQRRLWVFQRQFDKLRFTAAAKKEEPAPAAPAQLGEVSVPKKKKRRAAAMAAQDEPARKKRRETKAKRKEAAQKVDDETLKAAKSLTEGGVGLSVYVKYDLLSKKGIVQQKGDVCSGKSLFDIAGVAQQRVTGKRPVDHFIFRGKVEIGEPEEVHIRSTKALQDLVTKREGRGTITLYPAFANMAAKTWQDRQQSWNDPSKPRTPKAGAWKNADVQSRAQHFSEAVGFPCGDDDLPQLGLTVVDPWNGKCAGPPHD